MANHQEEGGIGLNRMAAVGNHPIGTAAVGAILQHGQSQHSLSDGAVGCRLGRSVVDLPTILNQTHKLMKRLVFSLLASAALVSCATGPGAQTGTVVGGLGGAALGGIIGNQSGRGLEGAAIGAGLGALAGNMLGDAQDQRRYYTDRYGRRYYIDRYGNTRYVGDRGYYGSTYYRPTSGYYRPTSYYRPSYYSGW